MRNRSVNRTKRDSRLERTRTVAGSVCGGSRGRQKSSEAGTCRAGRCIGGLLSACGKFQSVWKRSSGRPSLARVEDLIERVSCEPWMTVPATPIAWPTISNWRTIPSATILTCWRRTALLLAAMQVMERSIFRAIKRVLTGILWRQSSHRWKNNMDHNNNCATTDTKEEEHHL